MHGRFSRISDSGLVSPDFPVPVANPSFHHSRLSPIHHLARSARLCPVNPSFINPSFINPSFINTSFLTRPYFCLLLLTSAYRCLPLLIPAYSCLKRPIHANKFAYIKKLLYLCTRKGFLSNLT